jgi:hypothetical protein
MANPPVRGPQQQRVDLYQPLIADKAGPAPLVLRVGVSNPVTVTEGPISSALKAETYVLLSALPVELRKRVELAVQVLIAGR